MSSVNGPKRMGTADPSMKPAESLELPWDSAAWRWLSYRPSELEASMTTPLARVVAAFVVAVVVPLPAQAQWLTHPTPNLPRTADGKPNLAAPAPRRADGRPDLSGHWAAQSLTFHVPDEALTPQSLALRREREETYFSERPIFQ